MNKKPLILVVDDNADCRELLVWFLERHGFQTISAESGHEAVESAIRRQPGLVLMDLNMPGMNGYEATRAIHAHRRGRKIPVVAVSADCVEWFKRCAFEAGFIAFIAKPWEQDALLKLVTKVLTGVIESTRAA
jgi:twitching motility two-component system response regulator PilH